MTRAIARETNGAPLSNAKTNDDELFISEMRPASPAKGAFLLLHGMESHSGWFVDLATRLVGDGYAVIAYDRPGWGKSPGPRGHLRSYRDVLEQAAALAVNIRETYGSVHLAGMSWGGMAALYLALRRGWLFDSVALMAPGIAAQEDISLFGKCRVAASFLTKKTDAAVAPLFRPEHFTRDAEWRDFIHRDPDRVRMVTSSFCLETVKMRRFIREHAGKRLLPPALCLLAGDDRIVDNQAAAAVCRQAGAVAQTLPDCAHTLIFERPAHTAAILARHADAGAGRSHAGTAWIVGAGAVGSAMAALLAFGGVRTGVLAKPAHLEALRRNGLTLRQGEARRAARDGLSFAGDAGDLPPNPDLVILAVKSYDTDAALAALAGRVGPGAVLASLQNGVRNEERLALAFPDNAIVAAAVCANLELAAPGEVVWGDDRGGLGAALHRGNAALANTHWLSLMARTGMECRWYDGPEAARRLKWSKLMLNIGFNALNAVTGRANADILADDHYGELALAALREGFVAMERMNLYPYDLPGFAVAKMRLLVKAPAGLARRLLAWQAGRAAGAASSMRQDVVKNRQHTEIAELNGEIVTAGRRFGFPTPANAELAAMVEGLRKNA